MNARASGVENDLECRQRRLGDAPAGQRTKVPTISIYCECVCNMNMTSILLMLCDKYIRNTYSIVFKCEK